MILATVPRPLILNTTPSCEEFVIADHWITVNVVEFTIDATAVAATRLGKLAISRTHWITTKSEVVRLCGTSVTIVAVVVPVLLAETTRPIGTEKFGRLRQRYLTL